MAKDECYTFMQFLIEKNNQAREKSKYLLNKNKDEIYKLYCNFIEDIKNTYKNDLKKYYGLMKAFENKKCYGCDADMKWIKNYEFWGCPDYKNKNYIHSSYSNNQVFYHPSNPNYKGWSSRILLNTKFKGQIKAIDIYEYIVNELGDPDIALLNNNHDEYQSITKYIKTKNKSREFEKNVLDKVSYQYPNVFYQPGFIYQYENETEKKCFIDILASDENEVVIYECKANKNETNEEQKNIYIDIIKFLLNKKQLKKTVNFQYVFQEYK